MLQAHKSKLDSKSPTLVNEFANNQQLIKIKSEI
jgi:hypothetical protein